ncbi:MAG: S8 family serine peptidase [Candidatus Schekmanbacteria bacterium]|nr:S8 family serine peptidase [Candidatus Schekmanbacteria bacterium]
MRLHRNALVSAVVLTVLAASALSASADERYIIGSKRGTAHAREVVMARGKSIALELSRHSAVVANLSDAAVAELRKDANLTIEVDARRYMFAGAAEVVPFGISMVQADQLSDAAAAGIKVCIIDSGYNYGHEDLSTASNVTGTNDSGSGPWNQDGSGHGTHVAGTISALANGTGVVGVLPNGTVKLHIVRVFGDDGTWAYSSSLITAVETCRNNGADVISMSLGGSTKSRFEENAFKSAYAAGVLSIAAAGNDGNTRMSYPASYASVVSVAAIDANKAVADFSQKNSQVEVAAPGVAIKSTVPMGTGSLTTLTVGAGSFESSAMDGSPLGTATGPLVDCGIGDSACPGGGGQVCLIQRGTISFADKVLNCQAGGGAAAVVYNNEAGMLYGTLGETATTIPSAGVSDVDGAELLTLAGASATLAVAADNYASWDGTSMATPHVSGVAALVWSHFPSCTNADIRTALGASAQDLGAAGRDTSYGYGLIQAKAAYDYLTANPCGGGGSCSAAGESCSSDSDCCSGSCRVRRGVGTCQ